MIKLLYIIVCTVLLTAPAQANSTPSDAAYSGGKTTAFDTSVNAFSHPAANLPISRRDQFFVGNAFFKNPWVSAPSSTTARDGLGPLFNTNACQNCHIKDGRGHPPANTEDNAVSMLVRLSIPPQDTEAQARQIRTTGVIAEPNYGDQLQDFAIQGVAAEGRLIVTYTPLKVTLLDGESIELRQPHYQIVDLQYGELHPQTQFSPRIAPPMIGLGLLEAIPIDSLLANADAQDTNHDGISGRPNRVWDAVQKKTVIGRFGWKANAPNLRQQSAGAFLGDMGITSTLFSTNNCTAAQTDCQQAPDGGTPEISDELLQFVTFYSSMLAVPARRETDNPAVQSGEQTFNVLGCVACHVPTFKTGKHPVSELAEQIIHPYTDLLLHDMGEGLADNRPDFEANGLEWRTPPLWGIGLTETVSKHTFFLHDGRARNLTEAILWHDGEAKKAKDDFMQLSAKARDNLLRFLNSL